MISYELTHRLKRKTRGKVGYAALKADMSKAYDRVEWQFLEQVMHALGFPKKLIQWTMMCITSVKYSITHAGHATQFFSASRGLIQGCPLLPYLFILCAEGFSSLLRNYKQRGLIHRCKIARGAPSVSHIFFADDCLLWFWALREESHQIKTSIELYEKASGQQINFHKSSISFSANTTNSNQLEACNIWGVQCAASHGHYLGLPSLVGKNKNQIFAFLRDKVWHRIHNWKNRFLSRAGREVLIKTVAHALPTYAIVRLLDGHWPNPYPSIMGKRLIPI